MDLHHYSYRTIQLFITKGILPKTGNVIIHLDAHGDKIIPADLNVLTPLRARSARSDIYRDYGTEVWMKEAVDDGVLKHIIWAKPPWTISAKEGHRELENGVTVDVKNFCQSLFDGPPEDYEGFQNIFNKYISEGDPYIIDMEFNFFSADSPHAGYYDKSKKYYTVLQELFTINVPNTDDEQEIQNAVKSRYEQLDELRAIFDHLQKYRTLPEVPEKSTAYQKVSLLRDELLQHYEEKDIKWNYLYEDGNYANDYILPVHYTPHDKIEEMIKDCLGKLMDLLPSPPGLITMAVMYDYDRYTPKKDRKCITRNLENFFKSRYNVQIEYLDF